MTTDGRSPGSAALLPPTLVRHVDATGTVVRTLAEWETAALFVDLGGFTAMTEALTRFGRRGIDELRLIINEFFGGVADAVQNLGGQVIRFEGDAVVCLFDGGTDSALECGRKICEFDNSVVDSLAGMQTMRVSAGVGSGRAMSVVVEGRQRTHVMVLGDAIERAVNAQDLAEPGAVVLAGDSFSREIAITVPPAAAADRFIDTTVLERLSAGDDGLDEFREVSIVFASIPTEAGGENIADTIAALDAAGATPLTVTGDKGTSLLAVIGAPNAAPEQRRRALTAALEVRRLLGPRARVGLTTGVVFCGLVGGAGRAEYSIIGDRVNLAARLMEVAGPGEILVDEPTWSGNQGDFVLTNQRTVAVKGKVELVAVAQLDRAAINRSSVSLRPPLINQETIRRRLHEAWDEAVAGKGAMIRLSGSAGSGKTRLLEDLAAYVSGPVYITRFPRYRTARPYEGFFPGLRAIAGLDPDVPPTESQVAAIAFANPDWPRQRMSYLLRLLGSHITAADAGQAANEIGNTGREVLRATAVDLILNKAERGPIALMIDDAESADTASLDLLAELSRTVSRWPILVVTASRSEQHDGLTDSKGRGSDLTVADLSRQHAEALAISLREDPGLVDRVGTNPLALVMATRTPDTTSHDLKVLTQARIDQLPSEERAWLRAVSVFGSQFELDVASVSFGPVGIGALESAGLITRLVGTGGPTVAFAHSLLQEVAYDSLGLEHKSELHKAAGLALEASDSPAWPEELAHHFGMTDDVDRQRRYFRASGLRAADSYEFEAAIGWFRRLKPISVGRDEFDCSLWLGTWLALSGDLDGAAVELSHASSANDVVRVKALAGLARIRRHQGAMDESHHLLEMAAAEANKTQDPEARSVVLQVQCEVSGDNMDPGVIEDAANQLAALTGALGDGVVARANHAIGTARFRSGDGAGARDHLELALDIALRLEDDLLCSQIRSDIAGTLFTEERFHEALVFLSSAAQDAARMGYRRGSAGMLGNEAFLRYRLGDLPGALTREYASLRDLDAMGERVFALQGVVRAGMYFLAIDEDPVAQALLSGACKESQSTGQPSAYAYAMHHLARLDLDRGEWERATSRNAAGRDFAHAAGFHALDLEMGILEARAAFGRGDHTLALEALGELTNAEQPDHETAALLYERWLITGHERDRDAAAHAYRRRHNLAPSAHTARRLGRLTDEGVSLPEVADAGGDPPAPEAFLEFVS